MDQELISTLLSILAIGWTYVQQRWINKEKKKSGTTKDLFKPKRVG